MGHSTKTCVVLSIILAITSLGCAANVDSPNGSGAEEVGSVGIELQWFDRHFSQLSWTLRGLDNDEFYGDTIDISNTVYFISTLVENIIVGRYSLELVSVSDDGKQICRGHVSELEIVSGEITNTGVAVLCGAPDEDTGTLNVVAFFDDCPAEINWLSATPAIARPGEPITLKVVSGADWSSIEWSANSGTFDRQNFPETTYTCADIGSHTISVAVGSVHTDCPTNIAEITVECSDDPDFYF